MALKSRIKIAAPVYHLVYVSTASKTMRTSQLDDLLAVARQPNALVGITGLLVYGGGNFMQLLEGSRSEVEKIYRRIEADPRHFDVTTILSVDSPERWCADWAMAYTRQDDQTEIEGFRALLADGKGPLEGINADSVGRQLMTSYVAGNR